MTTTTTDLDARLDRLERQMARVLELLDTQRPSPLATAARSATAQLDEALGTERTQNHLTEMLVRLAEPETSESLLRIAELAPQLELALHAVAASPALLEEVMNLARTRLGQTLDPATRERRLELALSLVENVSGEAQLAGLRELAGLLPVLSPIARGTREALQDRTAVEGEAAVVDRAADLVLRLTDPETTDALLRLAELTPQLEYAAQFAAAGPALLEEGLDLAKTELAKMDTALTPADGLAAVKALARPDVVETITSLAGYARPVRAVAEGAARGLAAHVAHEGARSLEDRVEYAVLEVLRPETLDSLVRLAQLAPQLEYAAQFAAAGPALLEEGMGLVRKWTGQNLDGPPLEYRVENALSLLAVASEPRRLAALERIIAGVENLAPIAEAAATVDHETVGELLHSLADPGTVDGIRRLIALAPNLAGSLEALPIQQRTLEVLKTLNQAVEEAAADKTSVGAFGLLGALSRPEVKRAAGFGVGVAQRLGARLDTPALPNQTGGQND